MTKVIAMSSCYEEIKHLLGTTLGSDYEVVPFCFDSVLGHAAITFKTNIINNLKVPFIAKFAMSLFYF